MSTVKGRIVVPPGGLSVVTAMGPSLVGDGGVVTARSVIG
jgi:hypothetical protein